MCVIDIFTQISDSSGHMVWGRFEDYLRALLDLPAAVFEGPSFGFNETAPKSCFDKVKTSYFNTFILLQVAIEYCITHVLSPRATLEVSHLI